ncbi:hypothetical protein GYMLUDRAFT_245797 [Collybiopsis luxurians FD-317 M1]|uniref:Uncharacterized protein n=1 Tax=Collybiopsis luxurians FD-317 M1 TaxID=944289 RepID=A0A0D0C885_9AGAR|nr:hypothetical protein GYMLUDRAFT_245797 [Collybiopsis luxurians FD-317 M1]
MNNQFEQHLAAADDSDLWIPSVPWIGRAQDIIDVANSDRSEDQYRKGAAVAGGFFWVYPISWTTVAIAGSRGVCDGLSATDCNDEGHFKRSPLQSSCIIHTLNMNNQSDQHLAAAHEAWSNGARWFASAQDIVNTANSDGSEDQSCKKEAVEGSFGWAIFYWDKRVEDIINDQAAGN